MTVDIKELLEGRGTSYGKFSSHAEVTQSLKLVVFNTKAREKFSSSDQVEALEMILHKIGRIVNGDHDYLDNWVDIAGYAKLVADRLQGEEK
jgi:hypothetical protein